MKSPCHACVASPVINRAAEIDLVETGGYAGHGEIFDTWKDYDDGGT